MVLLLLSIILFAILLIIQGIRDRSVSFTLLACIPFLMIFVPILFLILGIPEESLPNISITPFWTILICLYTLLFVISLLKKKKVALILSFVQICSTAFWFSVISGFIL